MQLTAYARLTAQIYDAALTPEIWSDVLRAICAEMGAVGAAYIVRNRAESSGIEWLSFTGPCAEARADFVTHYAKHDPYAPLLDTSPPGGWVQLTKALPEAALRGNEWYHDFIGEKCRIRDIVGQRIAESPLQTARFSLHRGAHDAPIAVDRRQFQDLVRTIASAARLQLELARMHWQSAASLLALDEIAAGVVLVDAAGRLVEMNRAAERIARRGDGIIFHNNRISATRAFEEAKLARMIFSATNERGGPKASRMLIGRRDVSAHYVVTVAPLGADHGVRGLAEQPLALVFIDDLDRAAFARDDLTSLFGLSAAENRLVRALAEGKRLRDIADERRVRITTLRTQLSSALKKVGAARQSDLIRILAKL